MLCRNALIRGVRAAAPRNHAFPVRRRDLHFDGQNRLSGFWTPTQRQSNVPGEPENGHDLLARAGFLRQAHSGIFHLLPLGLRVQDKIERLIDKYMRSICASKVSMSSLSSEELWAKSGRLDKGRSSELLRLEDRKGAKFLLSPTHEEEITTIIANAVHSYKDLPLRLYQVSRKYRDELRPRQGLLRGREFLMKDLYTFDVTEDAARQTYEQVRRAYAAFFDELKMPHLTAAASSGTMGGNLSHEYHLASPNGEDTIISCDQCKHAVNEEIYVAKLDRDPDKMAALSPAAGIDQGIEKSIDESTNCTANGLEGINNKQYISKDRRTLCVLHYPKNSGEPNIHAVKEVFPDVDPSVSEYVNDTSSKRNPASRELNAVQIFDPRLPSQYISQMKRALDKSGKSPHHTTILQPSRILFTKAQNGDPCPSCGTGRLALHRAVEIGHTFHLGTRYSSPLSASILDANNQTVPVQMGCHGIGVSRLIGAVASLQADRSGLNWPLAICPFELLIIPGPGADPDDAAKLYSGMDTILRDVVMDDRDRPLGWKLKDADLVGYPMVMVMGRRWKEEKVVEVQCRRLGVKEEVQYGDDLWSKVLALRERL